MARVIVLDKIAQEGLDLLEAAPDVDYEIQVGLKGEELRETLAKFDGAVCRSGVKITSDALAGNRRLRAIVRAGVGTDNIDKEAATQSGIVVMNTPSGNTVSTAEHAFALLVGLARNLAPAHQSLQQGRWDRAKYMGTQLAGKTLGVIGLGRIGLEVAKRAAAFEMQVIGYDPFLSQEQAARFGIDKRETVDELLPLVDFLTVHTPLTPETKGLIGKSQIERFKPGVRLVNCARGGIYDEAAVLEALQSGQVSGVALDVYADEPCTDSPLFQEPRALCTPHLGASTEEAQTQVAVEAVQLLVNFLSSGEIRSAVNASSLDPKTLNRLRGYIDVAYRLGVLVSQWQGGAIDRARLTIRGDIAQENTQLLRSAFCAGLLEQAYADSVNIVNAEVFCRDRGIVLMEETSTDYGSFRNSVEVEVSGDQGTRAAGGTLFGNDMPRIFRLDNFRLESYVDGRMIIFKHRDVPGIIGSVGTLLAKFDVNIAQMSVGRVDDQQGGEAIGVLNVDGEVPSEAVQALVGLDHIEHVWPVHLPARGTLPGWL